MEESQENTENQVREEPQMEEKVSNPEIGFPVSPKPSKKNNMLVFIIIGIVILVGGIIFFVTKGKKTSEEIISPTPTFQGIETTEPIATSTAKPVNKENVSIEVLNGTGITGDAGYLQGKLRTLGYTDIVTGNATEQSQTVTTVTFNSSLDEANKTEIKTELEKLYEDVTVKSSTTLKVDVSIVTGLKVGQTAKPSATATAKPSATATSTASSSPTPTPTPTN